jgi:hypothetical protein
MSWMTLVGQLTVAVLTVMLFVLGPGMLATWFIVRQRRLARQARRSPLTKDLLRTPGHALRDELEELRLDVALDVVGLIAAPASVLAVLYATQLATGNAASARVLAPALVGMAVFCFWQIRRLLKGGKKLDQLRLGLDAELAAGQELDQLMRQGAAVFHDLQADKFNIDHVVVASQGVFAVETKGYRKPNRLEGKPGATVVYNGKSLQFPDWSSEKQLGQAQRQAKWLADWLTSATGQQTEVTPVLALPGWFVDRKGRGPVLVLSGSELRAHLLKAREARPLSAEHLERVVHQVEQRCRDVKPSYRPESGEG